MSTSETTDTLQLKLDKDAQRLVRRFREARKKVLETPETQRGPKNGYKKRVADMNDAAADLAMWIEVIAEQQEQAKN
ncbi:hypothetical protein [Pseudomonas sp.]|uniref:hypothetical protein n=1 Tax=Pseudomonas sp. TaxID=306 RepID=UPI001B04BA14|nr:hypothetical protein [Pseudomonas sp.]MBO9551731.1 hypothetical protein [Pseudomonas sp.]